MEENPNPSIPSFEPITVAKIVIEQSSDTFCDEIKKLLNSGD